MVGFCLQQLRKPPALGPGVPLDVELGIDLLDILLHAALREKQLFRDLAVAEPLRHQPHDLIFPLRQRGEGRRSGRLGEP